MGNYILLHSVQLLYDLIDTAKIDIILNLDADVETNSVVYRSVAYSSLDRSLANRKKTM
jgi:hypothetical protein